MNLTEAYRYVEAHPNETASIQEQLQAMFARNAIDRDFRDQLLSDPSAALSEQFSQDAPEEGYNIRFIENQVDATIVLPDYAELDGALSEDELEAIAGGVTPATASSIPCGTAAIACLTAGIQLGRKIIS